MLYKDPENKLKLWIEWMLDKSKEALDLTKISLKSKNYDENKIVFYKKIPGDFERKC